MHTMARIRTIIGEIRKLFGARSVSFQLDGECILVHSEDTVRELVRIPDIQTWGFPPVGQAAVPIRLRDGRSLVVGDQRGALREILEQVAPERRVRDVVT